MKNTLLEWAIDEPNDNPDMLPIDKFMRVPSPYNQKFPVDDEQPEPVKKVEHVKPTSGIFHEYCPMCNRNTDGFCCGEDKCPF